nr:MAG TPA: hypothetical protein [Caudoviricetes sp.]
MREPFADWELENFVGLLAMLAVIVLGVVFVLGTVCFVCWSSTQTPVQPEQTISQRIETTGDVKRLCIEAKTDGHIDAMSCELIDPHTGGVK